MFVVSKLRNNLLGLTSITAFHHIHQVDTAYQRPNDSIEQFPKVFSSLGILRGDYTIKLKEDTQPLLSTLQEESSSLYSKKCKMSSKGWSHWE